MLPTPRTRPRWRQLGLALTLLCSACGGGGARDQVPPGSGTVVRLELRPQHAAPSGPSEPRLLARTRFDSAELPAGITFAEELGSLVPTRLDPELGFAYGLEIQDGSGRVAVEVPEGAEEFNQLNVLLVGQRERSVSLRLRNEAKVVDVRRRRSLALREGVNALGFDVGMIATEENPITHVDLVLYAGFRGVSIVGVDWIYKPALDWLPRPEGDEDLVFVDGEARPAIGLSDEAPLETTAYAAPGATLEFDYAHPEFLGAARRGASLVVTLTPEGREPLEQQFPVGGEGWSRARIDLSPLAASEVGIRFELRGMPLVALGPPIVTRPTPSARTVVLITSDTHRSDHLGSAPNGVDVRTPFLDELGRKGALFADCASSANITNPSHVALMTSLTPRDSGINNNLSRLSRSARTLAEAFREAGYVCLASVSVNHLEPEQSGLGQGFDRFAFPPFEPSKAPRAIETMHAWLDEVEGLPAFLWLHVFDVHSPYTHSEEYSRLYFPEDRDPRDRSLPKLPSEQRLKWDLEVRDPEWAPSQYRAGVTYVDDQLRAFFAHPRIASSTFALTSDHGESLGESGHYWTHHNLGPETLFVPLIIGGGEVQPETVIERPVEQRDIGRTLLDLAGLEEIPFPGDNLFSSGPGTDEVRYSLANYGSAAALTTNSWFLRMRLTKTARPSDGAILDAHSIELFDRRADPRCEHDVAAEHPDVAARLRKSLVEWLVDARPLAPEPRLGGDSGAIDQDKLDQLVELGYTAELGAVETTLFDPDCACEACRQYP